MASSRLGAAGAGALSGASVGAIGGPIGAGIGGVLGGALGLLGGKSGSGKGGYNQFSTQNPQQAGMMQQLLSLLNPQQGDVTQNPAFQGGQNFLTQLLQGGPEAFKAFEAPYRREFEEQTIPGLAERFAGLGAGAQSSSAFQQQLGQAGASLSEKLAQLRSGLQMQALPQALNYAQQPFANLLSLLDLNTQAFAPKQPGAFQSFSSGLAPGIGKAFGEQGASALGDFFKRTPPITPTK